MLAAGYLPRNQEGLIDMSGPAAERSPFGQTNNVVIEFDPADDASWQDVEVALRRGLLRLAVHLADAAVDAPPDAIEELAPPHQPGNTPPPGPLLRGSTTSSGATIRTKSPGAATCTRTDARAGSANSPWACS